MITRTVDFDRLNALGIERRSEPLDIYFEKMILTREQKDERKELAKALNDIFLTALILFLMQKQSSTPDWDYVLTWLTAEIQQTVTPYFSENEFISGATTYAFDNLRNSGIENLNDDFVGNYAIETASNYLNNYLKNIENTYFNSEDRALFNAENEANTILNRKDYADAVTRNSGKTWHTMEDDKVRPTHAKIDGLTIPVNEFFHVGSALMLYPKDIINASDHPEEIINCRCSCTYP